jgi:hypothetical protein
MVSERLAFDILAKDHASQTFKKIGRSTDDVHKKFGFLSSRTKHLAAGMRVSFGAVAGVMGGIAAISVFKGFISEAEEAKKVSASTAQGIKTIGAGSWTSVKAIEALAKSTSKKIGVDDELIQTSANLLLTFKNIKNAAGANNDIFNRSVVAAQDLAAKGFGSAESAAKMLGKALNDPVKGMTALGRAGVQFSDKQKEVIKKLVESGDILGAQKIIMKEVEDQVGGTAAATVTGTEKMKVAWANFQEWVGKKLLPVIEKIETAIVDKVIPAMQTFVTFLGDTALPAVVTFGKTLVDKFVPVDAIKGAFDKVTDFIGDLLPNVKKKIKPIRVGRMIEYPDVEKTVGLDRIKTGLKILTDYVRDFFTGARGGFKPVGVGRLIEYPTPSEAGKLGQRFRDFFNQGIAGLDWKALGENLGRGLVIAIEWVGRNIAKLTKAFIDVLGKVDWFKVGTDVSKTAIAFALGFATGFINNVLDPSLWIGLIAHHWQELLFAVITVAFTPAKIIGSIGKALARIPFVGKMLEWLLLSFARISKSAVRAVARFLGRLFGAFAKGLLGEGRVRILKDVWAWLQLIPQRIREFIPDAQKWMRRMVNAMANAILSSADRVGRAIRAVIRRIISPFANAAKWLLAAGRRVLQGLWDGLKQKWEDVKKWFLAIPNWIKEHKGPLSFDRKLLVGAGLAIMGGFLRGLKSGGAEAIKYVSGITGDIFGVLFGEGVTGTRTWARGTVQLGQQLAAQLYGWTGAQWRALYDLWNNESGWNPLADNPTSTAFGIPQFLASTARAYGLAPGDTNAQHQIVAGLAYIRDAYGSPLNAWNAWQSRSPHWYEKGTPWVPQTGLAMLHRGEAVIPAKYNRRSSAAPAPRGDIHIHVTNQGVIGDRRQLERWLTEAAEKISVTSARTADLYGRTTY